MITAGAAIGALVELMAACPPGVTCFKRESGPAPCARCWRQWLAAQAEDDGVARFWWTGGAK